MCQTWNTWLSTANASEPVSYTHLVIFKLVGKHHLTTNVEALAVVVVAAQTAVHRSHRHIACTSHRRIRLRAVAEIEREIWSELECVA